LGDPDASCDVVLRELAPEAQQHDIALARLQPL
jgi:hypothetical protein